MATLDEVLEACDARGNTVPEGALEAFYNWDSGYWADSEADDIVRACEDAYRGEYYSGEDFARELLDEMGDIPKHLEFYIDYRSYWRDLTMSDGYYYTDGYVFAPQ
jgi:antirestriction protein